MLYTVLIMQKISTSISFNVVTFITKRQRQYPPLSSNLPSILLRERFEDAAELLEIQHLVIGDVEDRV